MQREKHLDPTEEIVGGREGTVGALDEKRAEVGGELQGKTLRTTPRPPLARGMAVVVHVMPAGGDGREAARNGAGAHLEREACVQLGLSLDDAEEGIVFPPRSRL